MQAGSNEDLTRRPPADDRHNANAAIEFFDNHASDITHAMEITPVCVRMYTRCAL